MASGRLRRRLRTGLLLWLALLLPLASSANLALHQPGGGHEHHGRGPAGEQAGHARGGHGGHGNHRGPGAPVESAPMPGMLCLMCIALGGPSLPGAPPTPEATPASLVLPALAACPTEAPRVASRLPCAQGCRGPPVLA